MPSTVHGTRHGRLESSKRLELWGLAEFSSTFRASASSGVVVWGLRDGSWILKGLGAERCRPKQSKESQVQVPLFRGEVDGSGTD